MLERGDKIGDYTLARFLGRGQFGEVWLAEKELQFSKRKFQHALKFLFNLGDEVNLKSAEAEIDTWMEASGHPNIMSVLDMLIHNDHIVIASEFAEGGSLKAWLSRSGGRAPSNEKALEMMTGILSGIDHLHSRNVVHRDLKPDNILLQGNFPRITDFGISRIVSAGSMSTVAMGSPFYMSPESFDGSKSTQTDIWSAGVILYEMLSGEHPYRSETIYGLVSAIRQAEPKPLPDDVPAELRTVVDTALQKDLNRRYQTAAQMREAIELEIYNLKIGNRSLLNTDDFREATVEVDPGATLVNEYFHDSLHNKPPAEPPPASSELAEAQRAVTEVYNVADSLKNSPLAEYVSTSEPNAETPSASEGPSPQMPPAAAEPPVFGDGRNDDSKSSVPRSAVAKFMESVEQEFNSAPGLKKDVQTITEVPAVEKEPEPAIEVIEASVSRPFENSDFSQTKKPLMLIGGIGSAIVAASIIGILALVGVIFIGRWLLARATVAPANQAVSTVPGNQTANRANTSTTTTDGPAVPENMVYISGGEFTMGRDDGEIVEESPAHKVTVAPFLMDKYEVTNEQYAEFMRATGHKAPQGWRNDTYVSGEGRLPVVGVSWKDADEYAKWKDKRLPTEAEWEFAARGTDGRLYPWGNEWKSGYANVDKAADNFSDVDKFPDGQSPFGLFAMVGNAGEWTADDFGPFPTGKLSDNYKGKTSMKTIRGVDFKSAKKYATVTYRIGYQPTGGSYGLTGFRCAMDAPQQ